MDGYKNINVLRNMLYNVHTKITEIHTTYIVSKTHVQKVIFEEKTNYCISCLSKCLKMKLIQACLIKRNSSHKVSPSVF